MNQSDQIKLLEQKLLNTQNELSTLKEEMRLTIEMQDKFIKDAIHEIHTPLSIIITNKDLIKLSYGNIKFLDSIEAACKVIQNSYEDMAYHAQMGKTDLKNMSIDLVNFVKNRCDYFESIAKANEISLSFSSSIEAFTYNIAETKLQRLVDNNISNAIKYANAGTTVTISILKNREVLELRFINLGRVIKDKKAVFKRFHREDSIKGGYGIGLNLVYEICQDEKIGVKLISSVKTGTIFCYSFKNGKMQLRKGK